MRGRPYLLLISAILAGCLREDVAADGPTTSAPAASTSASAVAPPLPTFAREPAEGEGLAMPRPDRRRLGAAVALNATCASCHQEEAAEWRGSRHRQSDTNAAYRQAFAIEPSPFCRGCHAPEADPARAPPSAVSDLGVGCVTCHVTEEGSVLATAPARGEGGDGAAPHAIHRSTAFARTGGCAGCHEFRFPGAPGDDDELLMQTTLREHRRSPTAERACASCHMPARGSRRSHAFAEVRDPVWLRDHLEVTAARADDGGVRVTLVQTAPGHAFPTGDLFRRLEVGCALLDADGRVLAREVRHLARHFELVPGMPARQLLRDDRVFGEPNVVNLPLALSPSRRPPARVSWWVSYQRVATVGVGTRPADAKIESEVPLHAGVFPWENHELTSAGPDP